MKATTNYWRRLAATARTMALGSLARRALLLGAFSLLYPAITAAADQVPAIKLKETVDIDAQGNGKFNAEMKLPVGKYTYLKANTPNMALLLRQMPFTQQWLPLDKLSGQFDDTTSSVRIEGTVVALARMTRGGRWEAPITDGAQLELITSHDNFVVLGASIKAPMGTANLTLHAVLPPGAKNVELLNNPPRLSYRLPAGDVASGSNAAVDFTFEAKEQVMTCLAKSYGNPKFSHLWAARCQLKNVGDQTVKNYRVRFRIDGFTQGWSPWQSSEQVVPNQTVVDAYFPMFDVEKLAQINGPRPAVIEMELEYTQADDRVVTQSDSRRVQLLGRNEVVFSTLKPEEAVGFYDMYNTGPMVLASFVMHEDPVIQQVAGWVSARAGGSGSQSDAAAIAFMKALYEFLSANQIVYQTPPAGQFNQQYGQHVKYGRDVLRNRAGTCIDLAILYGSVCEAVGLRPMLTLIPGHCFPAVYLPESGNLLAVETTCIGRRSFDDARNTGRDNLIKAFRDLPAYFVDVDDLHNQGVHGLELTSLPTSALADWGIRPAVAVGPSNTRPQVAIRDLVGNGRTASDAHVGTWLFERDVKGGRLRYLLVLGDDGRYACKLEAPSKTNAGEMSQSEAAGAYEVRGNTLVFTADDGARTTRQFRFENGVLSVHFAEANQMIPFRRAE
ncbi:MAG: transglutaminase domain-containing protein [Planctomycetia bacterium]|nr:transglutaminase domain-containing protein [Planctomycetia bacterium]